MESKSDSTLFDYWLPPLSKTTFASQWNPFFSTSCQGWSTIRQCSGPILFLIFINDLNDSLENPLYLFADDSTLCRDISHPSDGQAAASPLSSDLDKITNWSSTILLMYPYFPPFAFSIAPHCYLHPLFVRLRLLSPSALLLVFFPFSCCSFCYVVS